MVKEHQETIHQPEAEPVPEVIEEGEEKTKEETEESIYNNKLKTLKAKTNCCRTKKIHESSQNSLFDFSAAEIICLFQQTKKFTAGWQSCASKLWSSE